MAELKTPITTQEELDEVLKDRLERQTKKFEAEKAELEKKYSGYTSGDDLAKVKASYDEQIKSLNAKLDETKDIQTKLDEANASIGKYQLDSLKIKTALDNKLPYEFADRLKGNTAEELAKDAELFAKTFQANPSAPSFVPDEGIKGEEARKKEAFKAMLKDIDEKL